MCVIVGAPVADLIYNGQVTVLATASSFTFLNVPIGTPSADRIVYIAVGSIAAGAPASVTINGLAATLVVRGSTFGGQGIYSLALPSGTTTTVVIAYGVNVGGGHVVFSYSAYFSANAVFATAQNTTTSASSIALDIDTIGRGYVIGVSTSQAGTTATWSGVNLNQTVITQGGLVGHSTASAADVATATPRSASVSWSPSPARINGVMASFT